MSGWRPDLATGMPGIDAQHEELFRRAEAIDNALAEGRLTGETAEMLNYLAKYCQTHFALERTLMYHQNYPGLSEHVAQHAGFTKTLRQIQRDFASGAGAEDIAIRLNELVLGWLVNHIRHLDKEMGRFLRPGQYSA